MLKHQSNVAISKTGKSKWLLFKRDVIRDRQLYYLLIPVIIWYILFYYVPMYGIQMAFKDYKPFVGIWNSNWVGFKHFITFFKSPYAYRTIRNTLLIGIYLVIFTFPAPIILAILFNELKVKWFKTTVQTISYLPYFISTVVVAGLVVTMLSPSSGIINVIIEKFGGEKVYFLTKPEYFRTIFVVMNGWQGIGFGTIIYSSALCSIDDTLYEAANIDGADRFQKIFKITLPSIMPTIAIMFIIRMGSLLGVSAESIILLYQPITYETGDVISSFVYRTGLIDNNFSYAAAIDLFNGVISLLLVAASNAVSKKVGETSLF